jgi:hypothetical protein
MEVGRMRNTSRARLAVASLVATALSTVAIPAPAWAGTTCSGQRGLEPHTVGVLGQPITTTPGFSVSVCVTVPTDVPVPPTVDFALEGSHWMVELVHPDAGGAEVSATISYNVGNSADTETVTVPVPLNGGRTCLFFWGDTALNPGGCAVFLNN